MAFKSTPPAPGLLRRYVIHPAHLVFKIGDMSFEDGALLEPVSVCLHGIESAGVKLADPILVCGAGPIGLVSAVLARAAGAAPIAITDISESRLDFAKKLVPSIRTILVERGVSAEEVAHRAVEAMGVQPRVAIECTGVESSIATAIYAVKFSGTVHVIGVGKDFQNIPFMHASVNDINIKFQYRYANSWPKAIRLVNEGVIDVKPLVTHRFSLEDAKKAFATTSDPSSGSVKVMIFDEQQ
jgi:L-iditol 2-dehydrogenase